MMLDPTAVAAAEGRLAAANPCFDPLEVRSLTLLYTQYLHALGRKVRLRQRVVSTACVYFQRFFFQHTFLDHDPLLFAATALWMASKVEESVISPKHIVREMSEIALPGASYEVREVLAAEFVLLEALAPAGLAVDHPHAPLAKLLADADLRRHVAAERSDCLVQTATFLLNDAYRTPDLALCVEARLVALCCAHVAGQLEHVPIGELLPEPRPDEHEAIERVAASLLALYEGLHAPGSGSSGPRASASASSCSREALSAAHARLTQHWAEKRHGAALLVS